MINGAISIKEIALIFFPQSNKTTSKMLPKQHPHFPFLFPILSL